MRGRSSWRRTADATTLSAIALILSAGAPVAFAQLLDLKTGAGTSGVAGEATSATIDFLSAEAARLRDEYGRADAKASGELDPHAEAAFKLRIAARLRAADLLTTARDLGDAGAPQALAALTLIARFDAIDAWGAAVEREASGPTPAGDAALAFVLGESDAASTRTPDALDRWLSRVLGPRAQAIGPAPCASWDNLRLHAGWVPAGEACDDPTPLADLITRWSTLTRPDRPAARDRRISDDAAAALRAFDAAQAQAAGSWADAPGNARLERLIRTAGRLIDGIEPAPPRDIADTLAARFDSACKALGQGDTGCSATFEQLAEIVDVVDDTARALTLAPRAVTAAHKDLIWKYVWNACTATRLEDRARRDSLRRAVDAILAAANAPDENEVVRETRPVLRRLKLEMEMAQRELLVSLPRPAERSPMDDPGLVGSLATVRRLDGATRGLAIVSKLLEPPKVPRRKPDATLVKVRDRLLALAKDMQKPPTRTDAMNALLALLDAGDAFVPGPSERTLSASPKDGAWSAASSGKCPELLAALDAARVAALKAWGEGAAGAPEAIARVRSLTRLVELVHAGAIGTRIARDAGPARAGVISRHPAIELSAAAAAALLTDLEPAAARLVPLVLTEALSAPALKEVDKLHDASAAVRLIARLETQAQAMDLADVDPAIELAAPPGPRPWLAAQRNDLALICWNAHELAAAHLRHDRDQIDRRANEINELATRVLESLDRTR